MRTFETGATRDDDATKLDFEGFLSPFALKRYAEYMNSHRVQADGKLRDSDNWQKGIPLVTYMKSLFRHMLDVWRIHRGLKATDNKGDVDIENALCAVIFNASGYLHEYLKKTEVPKPEQEESECDDCRKCKISITDCLHFEKLQDSLRKNAELSSLRKEAPKPEAEYEKKLARCSRCALKRNNCYPPDADDAAIPCGFFMPFSKRET